MRGFFILIHGTVWIRSWNSREIPALLYFSPCFGLCWNLCLHSPSCAVFLALTIITQITSFVKWFSSEIIFLQCSGNINPVSAEKGGCKLCAGRRTESKGATITFEQLKDAFCPLLNIDGKTLIFAITLCPVFQKCPWMLIFGFVIMP